MKRRGALGLSVLSMALLLLVCLLTARDTAVIGRWATTVEVAQVAVMDVDFTFDGEGTYTCAIHVGAEDLSLQGRYKAQRGKLFLSDGLDYRIDPKVYDTYKIEGDVLTIRAGSGGELDGIFPLELKRVRE